MLLRIDTNYTRMQNSDPKKKKSRQAKKVETEEDNVVQLLSQAKVLGIKYFLCIVIVVQNVKPQVTQPQHTEDHRTTVLDNADKVNSIMHVHVHVH